jgi:hypothetical protein
MYEINLWSAKLQHFLCKDEEKPYKIALDGFSDTIYMFFNILRFFIYDISVIAVACFG